MTAAIISPRLLTRMPGFFPSRATIQAKPSPPTLDEYGQETETWADVSGLQNIACAKAPLSAFERQAAGYTTTDRVWHVLLSGAYPAITTRHRAVIDIEAFDIDAVEVDQSSTLTRLRVRQIGV